MVGPVGQDMVRGCRTCGNGCWASQKTCGVHLQGGRQGRRRGVSRRLVLTAGALLERRPATYEVGGVPVLAVFDGDHIHRCGVQGSVFNGEGAADEAAGNLRGKRRACAGCVWR